MREFESCSHEYHHLLGSEVTGIFFVRIECALQEETPPCRRHCCFTRCTTRSVCPPVHTLASYIMLPCVSCDSFEQAWGNQECSCSYLQFKFKCNENSETRCSPVRLYSTDCWIVGVNAVHFMMAELIECIELYFVLLQCHSTLGGTQATLQQLDIL